MRRWKSPRIPTQEEIAAYDGMHCRNLYLRCRDSAWRCPSCQRTAIELIRWTKILGPFWRDKYADANGMGWTSPITKHHCHGHGRFSETIICGDCNSADAVVKRKLKLPTDWSFSPEEIRQFVFAQPHGKHTIDYEQADKIYKSVSTTVF